MKKLEYTVEIHAEPAAVWEALWQDAHYRDWTSVFSAGSHAVTDNWGPGTEIRFLGPDGNGMYSRIEQHIPNAVMSFRHLGSVKDGVNLPPGKEEESWSGSMEIYTLTRNDDICSLLVSVDTVDDFEEFMNKSFPKALDRVKQIAESIDN